MKKLIITGNVGKDAEVLVNQNGEYFAKFSVAVSVGTKQNPKTDWVDVICNGHLVELAKNFIKKGGKVMVEGFPRAHAYIKDGVAIPQLRVQAKIVELLGRPHDGNDEPVIGSEPENEDCAI